MSEHRDRGDGEEPTDQDILIAFDTADEPVLTASELAEQFPVSAEAIRQRLEQLHEEGAVGKKKTGARSVAWWAEVAPRLSVEAAEAADAADRDDAVSLDELKDEFTTA